MSAPVAADFDGGFNQSMRKLSRSVLAGEAGDPPIQNTLDGACAPGWVPGVYAAHSKAEGLTSADVFFKSVQGRCVPFLA